jgi:acyl carrier protein
VIDQEVVIVDAQTLTKCLPDQVGEVWVSGPSVARGYWSRPDETGRTFGAYITGSGEGPFLRTGDLGFLHEGELFIAGRLKDLIIIRGLNYYPHDIERTVEQCHASLRPGCGAAISFLSEGEERLGIIQEINPEPHLNLDDIVANIIQVVTETHDLQPHAVALIEPGSIPKTSSGKIRRFASRGAFLAGNLPVLISWQAPSAPNGEINPTAFADSDLETEDIETRLQLLVAARLGVAPHKVDTDQIITRYGLDSLSAIELMHGIEESLKISLPLTMFFENSSIADLANEIKRQRAPGDSSGRSWIKGIEEVRITPKGYQSTSVGERN